jgi:hypothetical protein
VRFSKEKGLVLALALVEQALLLWAEEEAVKLRVGAEVLV